MGEPPITTQRAAGTLRETFSRLKAEAGSDDEWSSVLSAIQAAETALDGKDAPSANSNELEGLRHRISELEKALEARDDFIATVGHELRNPLSPIFMQVHHLLDVAKEHPERIDAAWLVPRLETCVNRVRRFLGTLDRILDISRINAGRTDLELERVDLSDVVREVCATSERQASASHAPIRLRTPDAPVVGHWDRLRLEQIALNLLSNAMRYGAGKPIDVAVESDAAVARLIVRDQGVGISNDEQEDIFLRFNRGGGDSQGASEWDCGSSVSSARQWAER